MVRDGGLVVKDSNGFYYSGLNMWSNQLRKAKIYHKKRYAEDVLNDKRFKDRVCKIIPVEINEKE